MATDVVVIFALDREAAPFRRLAKRDRLPVRVVVAGMGRDAARRAAEGVGDAALVVSAGFCGALDPTLRVGDVVVCSDVMFSGDASECGTRSAERGVRIRTASSLVATPQEKRSLRERTAADVVDMEAAAVAAVCAARGVPFLAVKAVSDTADTSLSPRLANLLAGGRVSPFAAAAAVLRQPSLVREFRRLARDTRVAARQLAVTLERLIPSTTAPG